MSAQSNKTSPDERFSIINGKVISFSTKKPIEGAKVIVANIRQGDITNNKGEFEIKLNYLHGIVAVKIFADGFVPEWFEDVILNADEVTTLNASLEIIKIKKRRIFKINHRDVNEIARMVINFVGSGDGIDVATKLGTIALENSPEVLQKVDSLIKEFDVPLKKIWLEVTIIRASSNGKESKPLTSDIKSIVKKLSSLLKFENNEVVGRAHAIGSEGSAIHFSSSTSDPKLGDLSVRTHIEYTNEIVQLKNIDIEFQKTSSNYIKTTVNIGNEETIILGVSQGLEDQGAIITAVTVKLID